MKKLTLLLLCFGISASAFSQVYLGLSSSATQSYWKWHIKNLGFDIDFEPALGYRGAVLGEWQVSPIVGVRAEFATQVKRNKLSDLEFSDGSKATSWENFQFWEGSLLLQFSPLKKLPDTYLLTGTTFGRMEKAWHVIKGSGPEFEAEKKHKSEKDLENSFFNRNAHAVDFGLGNNFPLGKTSRLKIEARYQLSLSDLAKSDNVDASVSSLLLTVGYLHRL